MAKSQIHLETKLTRLHDEFDVRGEGERKIKFDSLSFIA